MTSSLPMYVIYKNPADYHRVGSRRRRRPSKRPADVYVVRRGVVAGTPAGGWKPDPDPLAVVPTLEEARKAIPGGLHKLPRSPQDEPQVVETWF